MIKLTRRAEPGENKVPAESGSSVESLTRALMWALDDLGAELRLIDVGHMISYIHSEAHANIRDLVASSCELYFKEGALIYSGSSDMAIDWGSAPRIMLDLEFHHGGIVAKFEMMLTASVVDITLHEMFVEQADDMHISELDHLVAALKSARLKPISTDWVPKVVLN
ncbi:hypothetical protein [Breoghania sp.]|uniref:hypothetical protein n=1 Tax=Breoghania sp. TaxID=2065378 RepID=UPI002AA74062|nr:hypothetical protein [Breoghania sp.]